MTQHRSNATTTYRCDFITDIHNCVTQTDRLITATLNCRGGSNVHEALQIASAAGIHVLALQETRSNDQTKHPDWWIWYTVGDGQQAGVAIAVHHSLLQHQSQEQAEIHVTRLTRNVVAITLNIGSVGQIIFISVYAPQDKKERCTLFDNIIKQIATPNPECHITRVNQYAETKTKTGTRC
jgi:hypothetical protein